MKNRSAHSERLTHVHEDGLWLDETVDGKIALRYSSDGEDRSEIIDGPVLFDIGPSDDDAHFCRMWYVLTALCRYINHGGQISWLDVFLHHVRRNQVRLIEGVELRMFTGDTGTVAVWELPDSTAVVSRCSSRDGYSESFDSVDDALKHVDDCIEENNEQLDIEG